MFDCSICWAIITVCYSNFVIDSFKMRKYIRNLFLSHFTETFKSFVWAHSTVTVKLKTNANGTQMMHINSFWKKNRRNEKLRCLFIFEINYKIKLWKRTNNINLIFVLKHSSSINNNKWMKSTEMKLNAEMEL